MRGTPGTRSAILDITVACVSLALVVVLARMLPQESRNPLALLAMAAGNATPAALSDKPGDWGQDRRATQDATGAGQDECYIAANPIDPNNAIVVTKDYREALRNLIDTTTDGGVTWLEQPFPSTGAQAPYNMDPAVFFNNSGRAYIVWTAYLDFPNGGIYVAWSDDRGVTWSPASQVTPPSGHFDDKPWLVFDQTGGEYNGRVYAFWTRFGNAEILSAHSTDGGLTWSMPAPVSNNQWESGDDGAQPVVLPDGGVLVVFLYGSTPGNVGTLVLARSTDGGVSFSPNMPLLQVHQPPYTLPGDQWRLFTYHSLVRDPVRGWLTMIWGDYRDAAANGVDILLSRSTDDGLTWSGPTRLNDDPPGLVRDQWFPSLTAAPDGQLTALWLDRRDDPANRLYHAYVRSSTDGGMTWQPSVRVSSAPSDPNLNIPAGSDGIGDYIGIASGPGVVWGAWVDVRNGDQDIYAAREIFTPNPTPTATSTLTPTVVPSITPTATLSPTSTPLASPRPCEMPFSDVPPNAYFYEPVRHLYCRTVISGYADGTFRPWNVTTRGQLAKMITLAQGWPLDHPPQATFEDVPPGSIFYRYVETAFAHGVVTGYPCGGPGEPCGPNSRPYFRTTAAINRGQAVKIAVLAAGWGLVDPDTATYSDVPSGSTFYVYVETARMHSIISGYPCGYPEPCDPQARPYFRPSNPTLRGQITKIVYYAGTP